MSTKHRFLSFKIDIGLCLDRSRCPPNIVFYRSKLISVCVWIEADVHQTLFFIVQNRYRSVSGSKPMSTKHCFLSFKIDIGLCLDRTRCPPNIVFYRARSTSARVWMKDDVTKHRFLSFKIDIGTRADEGRCHQTTFFIGQDRHRYASTPSNLENDTQKTTQKDSFKK